ncbi:MAG: glycoside hydrolase family 32 protein [Acidimicrobiia bacterium]
MAGRPRFHFTAPSGWMNDPNGTLVHDGVYHLFYQHNPYRPRWGRIHWGHATSTDLVHWDHQPVALAPGGGLRERHCFSGCCAIAPDGTPTILYTRIGVAGLATLARAGADQCAAHGSDDLLSWHRYRHNPVLTQSVHDGARVRHWRDPYVFRHDGWWWMLLAGRERGLPGGSVLLYRGENLLDWEYRGRLCRGDTSVRRGLECPNYFGVADRWVLLISPYGPVRYSVGEFRGERHVGDAWRTFDHGRAFYATNTFDDGARSVVVGWIRGPRGPDWAGCLSLPREVGIAADGALEIAPVAELATLRQEHRRAEAVFGPDAGPVTGIVLEERAAELAASFRLDRPAVCGFEVRSRAGTHRFAPDLAHATVTSGAESAAMSSAPQPTRVDVRAFLDESVLEVFVGGRDAFTSVVDLGDATRQEVVPFVSGAAGTARLDVWQLAGI